MCFPFLGKGFYVVGRATLGSLISPIFFGCTISSVGLILGKVKWISAKFELPNLLFLVFTQHHFLENLATAAALNKSEIFVLTCICT